MSDNVAYLETTKTTHICVWIQGEGTKMPSGRWSWTFHPATLCGWRKENFQSRARVLYTLLDEVPRFPLCQTCVQVAEHAAKLAALTSPVLSVVERISNDKEENKDA